MMDIDFVTCDVSDEEALEFDENHDNSVFDGERCGICMDIIIDRGIIDCCEHWFCFGCIDDWATVTNLCPLCQSEFQSITCVPVYDTIGNNTVDEASFSGEDDWSFEGKSGTLSFPSYYIDENAVTCLDGDGCRIRSGLATIEDDSNLDTSIACDSCDIWYHAVCVGFDPEATSEDTWLCPRCSITDDTSIQCQNNQCHTEISLSNKTTFSGKVSVSVVDAGETAVVVSMVEPEEQRENFNSAVEANVDLKVDGFNSDDVKLVAETTGRSHLYRNMDAGGLDLILSGNAFSSPYLDSLMLSCADETTNTARSSTRGEDLPKKLCDKSSETKHLSGSESGEGLHLGLSMGSSLPGDNIPADVEEDIKLAGTKRKHAERSDKPLQIGDGGVNCENEAPGLKKKIREREKFQVVMSDDHIGTVLPNNSQKSSTPLAVAKVVNFKRTLKKEDDASDIMTIVRGTDRRPLTGHDDGRSLKFAKEKRNKAGLRVKKIMRIAGEDKESSVVVQKLRKEIRDAVRNKSSTEFGENLFDSKLLDAFRAAIAGSITEPVKKLPPGALKMKTSLMQKGKVREKLTKKIYGDSNGRRRRAWNRDCDVEFWKYRCTRATKPEKVATLNSVLNLLRKHPEGSEKEETSKSQEGNPLLSRLYLADTSVFPRKDDIVPLSALAANSNSQQNAAPLISVGESQKPSSDHSMKVPSCNKVPLDLGITSVDGIKDKVPCSKGKNAPSKAHFQGGIKESSVTLSGSKSNSPNKQGDKTESRNIDKRKWALEVLARKKAVGCTSTAHEREEDDSVLKGNFPLLGQLPKDMRPEPAPSRHKKIPMSVRQKQLYRMTEHFLRKLDLPEMRRTAETELVVADAINIEKEVANRSNSKQGYLNHISHEISRRSDGSKSFKTEELCSEAQSVIPVTSEPVDGELSSDPEVLSALRNAGLLSDSPPSSPHVVPAEANESNVQIEGSTSVFEMDSTDDADIYGDFEYDLDDEDYIGASAIKVSKQPLEEGKSKVKVVLTTLKSERLNGVEDYESDQSLQDKEKQDNSASSLKSENSVGINGSTTVVSKSFVSLDSLPSEEGAEPSLAECEELYGPDKDLLINKLPEEMHHRQAYAEASTENGKCESNEDGKIVIPNALKSRDGDEKPGNELSKQCDASSVSKKVEAYIKEHIRPLCKSGIITAEQYRWAVSKTTDKVMKYHSNSKNANFLIKEGEKVKKLAEQYVQTAQQKGERIMSSSLN